MLVLKEVIRPGVYWYKDQKGQDRRLVVTPASIKNLHKTGTEMIAAGLSIPVPLEHPAVDDPAGSPLTRRELAVKQLKDNSGFVQDYKLRDGALFATVDIKDEAIAKKVKEGSIAYTSPKISPPFKDGDGTQWPQSITHLALTLRPRVTKQLPFQIPKGWDGAALMSLDQITEPVCPSVARTMALTGDKWHIRYPILFALEDDIPEEPPVPKKKGKDDTDPEPDALEEDTTVAAGYSMPELISLLEAKDIHLPPDTNEGNFAQHLWVALHAITGPEKAAEQEADKLAAEAARAGSQAPPVTQESPPAMMSLADCDKITDPRVAGLMRQALKGAAASRTSRIQAICGRNKSNTALAHKLTSMEQAAPLSLKGDGSVHDPLSETLDLLDAGIADIASQLKTRANGTDVTLSEAPHPTDTGLGISQDVHDRLVSNLAKAAGATSNKPVK